MALDWLKDPVTDDAPCGPDLEATDDGKFVDYYFEAESEMPERYFTPSMEEAEEGVSPGVVFDRNSVDWKSHQASIHALLERSRDLRLLSLLARVAILAGRLGDFSAALVGMADAMEAFPEDIHPKATADRRSAIEELSNNISVIFPLQYAELAGPGEVSLRRLMVANGDAGRRPGEDGLTAGKLSGELAAPSNKKPVDAAHQHLLDAQAALVRIKKCCLGNPDGPINAGLDKTEETIAKMIALIDSARPDLGAATVAAEAQDQQQDAQTEDADDAGDTTTAPAASGTITKTIVVTTIPNREAALQTLSAIEVYFATNEPASPALLLVTQARLLFGRPLVEAIETLLPSNAAQAKIDFGPETGFVLDMGRLKQLASEALGQAQQDAAGDPGPAPEVSNRADVAGHLAALDEFYRAREPASPIPVLLARARNYLEKDFSAIVTEIIPPKVEQSE